MSPLCVCACWWGEWAGWPVLTATEQACLPCPQQSPVRSLGEGPSCPGGGRASSQPHCKGWDRAGFACGWPSRPSTSPRPWLPAAAGKQSMKQGPPSSSVPAKHFSLLLLLHWEQRPPLDKRRATRKGEAPPTPRPRDQMQAGDQSLSLSLDLVGSANWVKPTKKPWVFCADPAKPPESATFPKRSSNPCPGAPRRDAAASEAPTERETDLSWQLWPILAPAVGMATICSVWGEISLEQRLLLPKNKKVGSHSILERKWNLESDLAL